MSTVQDAPTLNAITESPAGDRAPFLFTAEAFFKMLDAEVFDDDDRVELWDGWIISKMAKMQPQASAGIKMTMTLVPILPAGWCLSGENPVALGPKSVPLPDYTVLRGNGDDYAKRRPAPDDVGLLVELSFSSLKRDLGAKLAAYAGANIQVYWVVNLQENLVVVFERPDPAQRIYEMSQTYAPGQVVPFRLDGVLVAEISVRDLLPVQG